MDDEAWTICRNCIYYFATGAKDKLCTYHQRATAGDKRCTEWVNRWE